MTSNKKVIISLSIIGLLLVSLAISYAYFSAKITNNESESTVVATAAYLELTFIDGSPEINASNILPGWSASKTFSVQNTGENTAYYVLRITDITNPFVYGGISYKIESNDGGTNVALDTLPLANMPVTGPIEIPVNTTHNYTITTYYNELEENQLSDLGKSFSYTVSIEAVYKKEIQYIEDLVDLSNEVNSGNKYAHTWFVLTRDLDFNNDESYKNANNTTTYGDYNGNGTVESIKTELTTGRGFYPIGNSTSHPYSGNLDGQNHRLDNLFINNTNGLSRIGLFGFAYPVENIGTFRDLTISGSIKSSTKNVDAGGFCGNCRVILYNMVNEVNVTKTISNNSVGGFFGSTDNAYVKNCKNKGTILHGNNTAGIAGWANKIIIEKSSNEGVITNSKGKHAGGLVGRDENSSGSIRIYNSYNIGNITANVSNDTFTGGLVGLINGSLYIENSYNNAIISRYTTEDDASSSYLGSVGGIVGASYFGKIINSYNIGKIVGGNRTGGIVGKRYKSANNLFINNCINKGTISSDLTTYYTTVLGGIIGYPEATSTGNIIVLNSYNTGDLSTDISNSSVGGLNGRLESNTYIINSYNIADIKGNWASGISGSNHSSSSTLYLNNVYTNSVVNGSTYSYGLAYKYAGNLNVTNAYYPSGISGSNVSDQTGTSLTAEYMASPEFVNLLNQNKRNINLSTIYSGALSGYSSYELSDWKYDAEKGYPVLDN